MLDRNDIPFVHWQMKRDAQGSAVLGEIAAELDDLAQEIRQCILTPKRSVPLNPEKGCDLEPHKDRPINVRHLFVAAEIRAALARDVPRVRVHEVVVAAEFTTVDIKVIWTPTELVLDAFITTEVAYVL
jgi:phage baseplate assembly protein W